MVPPSSSSSSRTRRVQKKILLLLLLLLTLVGAGKEKRRRWAQQQPDYIERLGLGSVRWPDVDTQCRLSVDGDNVTLTTRWEKSLDVFGTNHSLLRPTLCEYQAPGTTAILTITTSLAYLGRWRGWTRNKLCYAKKTRTPLLLFVDSVQGFDVENAKCPERSASLHWIKAVALATVFERSRFDVVLALDADTVFTKQAFALPPLIDCYARVAKSSVAAGLDHYQVFVNAAALVVKKSNFSDALLRLWWRDRCGDKDQLVLWHALFTLWGLDEPDFSYHGELLEYASRKDMRVKAGRGDNRTYLHARRVLAFELALRVEPNAFEARRSPTGRIILHHDRILEFPHFALLPHSIIDLRRRKPLPACDGIAALPPFRKQDHRQKHDVRGAGFLSHTKNSPPYFLCDAPRKTAPSLNFSSNRNETTTTTTTTTTKKKTTAR